MFTISQSYHKLNLTNNEFSWMAGSLLSVLKPKAWPFRNAWQVQQTAPKCTKI